MGSLEMDYLKTVNLELIKNDLEVVERVNFGQIEFAVISLIESPTDSVIGVFDYMIQAINYANSIH